MYVKGTIKTAAALLVALAVLASGAVAGRSEVKKNRLAALPP